MGAWHHGLFWRTSLALTKRENGHMGGLGLNAIRGAWDTFFSAWYLGYGDSKSHNEVYACIAVFLRLMEGSRGVGGCGSIRGGCV